MSNRIVTAPQVHLHWVREAPSRALALPISSSPQSLESLPACVQKAAIATGLESIEVHLPPYRPAYNPDLDVWLAGLQFRQDTVGRLIATHADDPDPLATMAFHQAAVLVMRAVYANTTPLTIVAELGRSMLFRQPLALRHQCSPLGGLANAPTERSRDYFRAYRALSLALQSIIRESLPPAHVKTVSQFEDRDHILALLAWSAAEPVVGRHVDELGVDVLNPLTLNRAYANLPKRLAPRLAEVWEILVRQRADPAICDSYNPSKALRIANRCRQRGGYANLLFSNEVRLISAFVQFCARIGIWRARAGANPATIFRELRDSWEDLEVLIRRFYQRRPHSALGSLLLLEAVRTLEALD
jgi:hypothetical protein